MVDPVSSSSVAPVQPAAPAASSTASARPAPAPPAAPVVHALSGSVQRGENDDFVYALKDTNSGRVVVVIPHVELRSDGLRT